MAFGDFSKYHKIAIISLIGLVFIFLRIVYLESDVPITQLTEYAPIDETYYNSSAFNLYHYGSFNHRVVSYVKNDVAPTNILENIMTYMSLKIGGNNYYGLRMASVLAASLVMVFLYLFLCKLVFYKPPLDTTLLGVHSEKPYKMGLIILALIYMTIDFSFLLAGRIAEPTIFRMMAMMFIMLLMCHLAFAREKVPLYLTCIMGFLSLSAVLFVYIYNIFIFCAVGMTLLLWAWSSGWKNVIHQMLVFFLGAMLSFLSYKYFCNHFYGMTITELLAILMPFKYRMGLSSTGLLASPKHYIMNFIAIFSTNIFRFNSALLFVFLASIPPFVMHIWKTKDKLGILIANLLVFLVLQCIVINDYNFRKLVILLPLVLITIFMALTYQEEFINSLRNHALGKKLYGVYWILIGYFFVFFMQLGSITPSSINTEIQINPQAVIPANINRINLAVFLFVFIIATMKYLNNKKTGKVLLTLAVITLFIPGIYMDVKYVYMNPSYTLRDTMIAMKDKVDDKIVAGGVAYGFRLYNRSIPILDFYSYSYSTYKDPQIEYIKTLKRLFEEKKADYTLRLNDGVSEEQLLKERGIVVEKEYKLVTLYRPE